MVEILRAGSRTWCSELAISPFLSLILSYLWAEGDFEVPQTATKSYLSLRDIWYIRKISPLRAKLVVCKCSTRRWFGDFIFVGTDSFHLAFQISRSGRCLPRLWAWRLFSPILTVFLILLASLPAIHLEPRTFLGYRHSPLSSGWWGVEVRVTRVL